MRTAMLELLLLTVALVVALGTAHTLIGQARPLPAQLWAGLRRGAQWACVALVVVVLLLLWYP